MRNNIFLWPIVLIGIILGGCLNTIPDSPHPDPGPSTDPRKVTLSGLVRDANSDLALWSGKVTLAGQGVSIKDGAFELNNLTPGNYTLTVTTLFYKPLQKQVALSAQNNTIEVRMTPIFSADELDLLARLVHAEAKGEKYEGQVAVAASILNRVAHPDYPNTLTGVINQVVVSGGKRYYQYEPVLNGSIKTPASATAKYAVADALAGWDPSRNATGFFAPAKVSANSWVWNRTATVTIGNHRFFK